MTRRRSKPGFTLLELVLVLVIAATALAIAAPSLRSWRRGAALRASMDQMMTLMRLARTQSISDGKPYRLVFDESLHFQLKMQQGSARQQDGTNFVEVPGDFGKLYSLPDGSRIEIVKGAVRNQLEESSAQVIEFYPTGRTQPAKIIVTDADQFEVVLECTSPAGRFRQISEGVRQ